MKQSPSPSRSAPAAAAPRSGAKSSKAKPKAPAPPLSANERGVQRRAKKKAERRRKNWLVWLGFAAATAVIVGTAAGVRSELKHANARVASKQSTLKALQNQLAQGKRRLSAFKGGSGRERALAENGFIKPGERILLFPSDSKSKTTR
ncbi:hypothetical protein EON83_05665 [bacterium]|nr:MAG: hypothetical protein EON83_05665 [bacterium]